MIGLSPGVLASGFQMLDILRRRSPMSLKEFSLSFPRVGVCKTDDVCPLVLRLSWIRLGTDGLAEITGGGNKILALEHHESRMRQSVLDFVEVLKPTWVQNATYGRHKVLSYVGPEVRQVLVEAGLATSYDPETVRFWDTLAAMARGQHDITLAEIGRRGERLTIDHETNRTGRKPKWVSLENNADGYDVLSVLDQNSAAKLSIEVKATTVGPRGVFHITRNEWERALEAPFHCFHLWLLRGESDLESFLAVVPPAEMSRHVPADNASGIWSSFRVPFDAFERLFAAKCE